MPWEVARSKACYSLKKPWAVYNKITGRVVACHETYEKARLQQQALYATEKKKGKRSDPKLMTFEEWKAAWQRWYEWKERSKKNKRGKGNPHHKGKGKGGGQFTFGVVPVSQREADLKIMQLQNADPEKYWTVSPTHEDTPKTFRIGTGSYVTLYEKPDGTVEIGSLVGDPGQHGIAARAVAFADEKYPGQDQVLDAFDTLVPLYEKLGFKETGRLKFDPQYAPPMWEPGYGKPDVVFMRRPAVAAVGRANPYHVLEGPKGGQFTFKPGVILGVGASDTVMDSGWQNLVKDRHEQALRPSAGEGQYYAGETYESAVYWRSYRGYQNINNYLRYGRVDNPTGLDVTAKAQEAELKRHIQNLRDGMKPSKTMTYAWRGAAMDRELKPGDRFTDKGIVAVSPDESMTKSFPLKGASERHPYRYKFTVVVPKGTPGLLIDQYEGIMNDGTYRVESIGGKAGVGPTGITEAVIVREPGAQRNFFMRSSSGKRPNPERFVWTDDDVVFLAPQRSLRGKGGNPWHKGKGKGGGQFTSAPGGGLELKLPKPKGFVLRPKKLGVDSTLDGKGKNHPTRKKVDAYARGHGFKNAQQAIDECTAEMDKMINPGLLAQGRAWYREENMKAHRRGQQHGVSAEIAVLVESATSPHCKYVVNQRATDAILERARKFKTAEEIVADYKGDILGNTKLLGAKFAKGLDPNELTGAKRRSFHNNIMLPAQTDDVTIDTRMARILQIASSKHQKGAKRPITAPIPVYNKETKKKQKDPGLDAVLYFVSEGAKTVNMNGVGGGYYIMSDAVRNLAAKYRESPDTIQAAVWIAIGGDSR